MPTIIVLDIIMPEMDGFETINLLAEKHYYGHLILMGCNLPEYLDMADKAGKTKGLPADEPAVYRPETPPC